MRSVNLFPSLYHPYSPLLLPPSLYRPYSPSPPPLLPCLCRPTPPLFPPPSLLSFPSLCRPTFPYLPFPPPSLLSPSPPLLPPSSRSCAALIPLPSLRHPYSPSPPLPLPPYLFLSFPPCPLSLQCSPEYKVPGLYVIDSIVRQSRHQLGTDKDVYGPRFTKKFLKTFRHLFQCSPPDQVGIKKSKVPLGSHDLCFPLYPLPPQRLRWFVF